MIRALLTTCRFDSRNADVIKVMATGGVLSKYDNPHHQEFTNDELSAIVHEASMKGRAVAAHCHGEAGIRAALEAGALTVEHATYLTEDLCDLMVAKGALLVPTLYVVRRLLEGIIGHLRHLLSLCRSLTHSHTHTRAI